MTSHNFWLHVFSSKAYKIIDSPSACDVINNPSPIELFDNVWESYGRWDVQWNIQMSSFDFFPVQ